VDSVDKLAEIVWCNHLRLIPSRLVGASVPHAYLPPQKTYIIVEERKVKLVCPECWKLSIIQHSLFSKEHELH
jgi:hypothetical protein